MTRVSAVLGGCFLAAGLVSLLSHESVSLSAAEEPAAEALEPVEADMHEFMEYEFEPVFKRLKPAMAEDQSAGPNWKLIKSDALILAEGGNLLLMRGPKEEAAKWAEHSRTLRVLGGKLYRAAKAKDFPAARDQYAAMVKNCNACHNDFAGGEHQLTP